MSDVKVNSFIQWLRDHWFVLAALVAAGTAWGQQQEKTNSQGEKIGRLEAAQVEIRKQGESIQIIERNMAVQSNEIKNLDSRMKDQNAIILEQNRMLRALLESNRAAQRIYRENE